MELTISFIAGKLQETYRNVVAYNDLQRNFSRCRVLKPGQTIDSKALYVVPNGCDDIDLLNEYPGLILTGPDWPLINAPLIWIKDDVDPLEALAKTLDVIEQYTLWTDKISNLLLNHAPTEKVVQLLSEVASNPFVYLDNSLHVRCMSQSDYLDKYSRKWKSLKTTGSFETETLATLISSGELDRVNNSARAWVCTDSKVFVMPMGFKTIMCDDNVYGYLMTIGCSKNPALGDVEPLEALGNLISRFVGHSMANIVTSAHFIDQIIKECLVKPHVNATEIANLASLLEWDVDDSYRVSVFAPSDKKSGPIQKAHTNLLEANLGGRAVSFESLAVHIGKVTGDTDDHAFVKQAQAFCKSLKWKMGLSNSFKGLAGLGNAYLQGKMALREGQQRQTGDSVFRYGDYRVDFICTELLKQVDTPFLISRDIVDIAAYDEENGTNLLDTLEAYLRNERSMTKTSNCMFLHRNSVAYRIEKVKAMLRCDLDNPETRVGLQLSLRIWRRLQATA